MPQFPVLPEVYKSFLEQCDGQTTYIFNDNGGWRLYSKEELVDAIRIDREEVLTIHQLSAFVNAIREFQGDETEDQDGEPYSLDRLATGLAIGENNGEVLFLDPSDAYSVWIWHPDGSDVERLVDSFDLWLDLAVIEEDS